MIEGLISGYFHSYSQIYASAIGLVAREWIISWQHDGIHWRHATWWHTLTSRKARETGAKPHLTKMAVASLIIVRFSKSKLFQKLGSKTYEPLTSYQGRRRVFIAKIAIPRPSNFRGNWLIFKQFTSCKQLIKEITVMQLLHVWRQDERLRCGTIQEKVHHSVDMTTP